MLKKFLVIVALTSGFALSACNTVHGAANDVGSAADCADGKANNC